MCFLLCLCRLLLSRPTQLALVKGESYEQCTRKAATKVQYDLIPSTEALLDLVGRIQAEQEAIALGPPQGVAAAGGDQETAGGEEEGTGFVMPDVPAKRAPLFAAPVGPRKKAATGAAGAAGAATQGEGAEGVAGEEGAQEAGQQSVEGQAAAVLGEAAVEQDKGTTGQQAEPAMDTS